MQALPVCMSREPTLNFFAPQQIFDKYLNPHYFPALWQELKKATFTLTSFSPEAIATKVCEVIEHHFKQIAGLDEVFSFIEFLFALYGRSGPQPAIGIKILALIFRSFIVFQNGPRELFHKWHYYFKTLSHHVFLNGEEEKKTWFHLISLVLQQGPEDLSVKDYELGKKSLITFFIYAFKLEHMGEENTDKVYLDLTRCMLKGLQNKRLVVKEIAYLLNHPKREEADIQLVLAAFEKHEFSIFQRYVLMSRYLAVLSQANSTLSGPDEVFLSICENLFKKSLGESSIYAADFMALISLLIQFPELAKMQSCYQCYLEKLYTILGKKTAQYDRLEIESICRMQGELFKMEQQALNLNVFWENLFPKITLISQMLKRYGISPDLLQKGFSLIVLYFKYFAKDLAKSEVKNIFRLISKNYKLKNFSHFNRKLILQTVLELCLSKGFIKHVIPLCEEVKKCFNVDEAWLSEVKELCQATPLLTIEKNLGLLIPAISRLCFSNNCEGKESIPFEIIKLFVSLVTSPEKLLKILQASLKKGESFNGLLKSMVLILDCQPASRVFKFKLAQLLALKAADEERYKYSDFCLLLKILGKTFNHFEVSFFSLTDILCKPFYFVDLKDVVLIFDSINQIDGASKNLEKFWELMKPFEGILKEERDAIMAVIYYNWMIACGQGKALDILRGIWKKKALKKRDDRRALVLLNNQIWGQGELYFRRLEEIMQICYTNIQKLDNKSIKKQTNMHFEALRQSLGNAAKKFSTP
ncbi:hypothetical protein [Parachlamydia sp. AcF125]|uniref:hypothetical protein n=1 Tax=Parachlamydia sp. AcF125 TaxID=2795736 RepID=UPI001BC9E580|nr:hypothetical protein [Parachlamydia sp. AcF125]MBS4168833.1 hypothetical protein [Parachlamydia sp. AcF125]